MASHQPGALRILAAAIFVITIVAFAQSQTPDAVRKSTGSISGRVTVDGKPAASIYVAAVAGETINRREAAAHAITDSEGHFAISGLAAGQYQVWTITPNLIADANALRNFPYYGAWKSVNLDGDEQVTNVDLRLMRGSVITGRVTNADNKPVVGEAINLQLFDKNGSLLFTLPGNYDETRQTDDRGIFRIYGLQPGRYKVFAGTDPDTYGFRGGRRYEKAFYLDPADQSRPGIVELAEGDVADNIDIRVQPAPPVYSVTGRVIDSETGTPIAKAGVWLNQVTKDNRPRPGLGIQANDQGEFNYSGVAAGRYIASPTAEFYGGNFYGDPVEFEIVDKDVTDIQLKTTPGLSLSGVVVAEGLSNKELLSMLPGLTVWASSTTDAKQGSHSARAAVAADGSFQLGGLRAGKVLVSANSQTPPYRMLSVRLEHEGTTLPQNFDLQQSLSGLRIVIAYGTGTLRGTIKFAGDATADFSRIRVTYRREDALDNEDVRIDMRGRFAIGNLEPGAYEVVVQMGGRSQKQTVSITNGQETEVTFTIDLAPRP